MQLQSQLQIHAPVVCCQLVFTGEWESRFDKELTGKDRFYINSTASVEVVMMLAPKYPLSMLVDNELGAQVGESLLIFSFLDHYLAICFNMIFYNCVLGYMYSV